MVGYMRAVKGFDLAVCTWMFFCGIILILIYAINIQFDDSVVQSSQ